MAITAPQHIEEAIEYFKEEVNTNVVNPAKHNMFSVHIKSQPLDHENTEMVRSITAKLLWIMKISIPDL